MDGHVAASGVASLAPVEQPEVGLLQVPVDSLHSVQRVVDREEDRRLSVKGGRRDGGLKQPGRVAVAGRLHLRVEERELDDAPAVTRADLDGQLHTVLVGIRHVQWDPIRVLAVRAPTPQTPMMTAHER